MVLALFERLGVRQAESFDHVHGLIEATKRALQVRDGVITDPDRLAHSVDRYLTSRFLDAQAGEIDRRKAAPWPAKEIWRPKTVTQKLLLAGSSSSRAGAGDTVWMGSADASGIVVSYIQSLYWEFGSGVVLPATGVLMQNRGASFSLDPSALNALEPGRLPFHTLSPAIAALDDGRIIAYGAMGGDGQPQTQAAIYTRHVVFGEPIERAIDAPRWLLGRTWGAEHDNLRLEKRFDGNLIDRLASAGHDVEALSEPYSNVMGHAGAVIVHPGGTLEATHDPRADGGAAGV
jgi:gamma-glutamyltranspeptidase/glutathione hydrolase